MAAAAFNNLESPLSMVEKTAWWILPVINQVSKKLIKENQPKPKPVKPKSDNKEGSGMADVPDFEEDEY